MVYVRAVNWILLKLIVCVLDLKALEESKSDRTQMNTQKTVLLH